MRGLLIFVVFGFLAISCEPLKIIGDNPAGTDASSPGNDGLPKLPMDGNEDNIVKECRLDEEVHFKLRRLSNLEYDRSLSILFGRNIEASKDFEFMPDKKQDSFAHFSENLAIDSGQMKKYIDAAKALADSALQSSKIVFCNPTGNRNCVRDVLQNFAKRAFRGNINGGELNQLLADAEALPEGGAASLEHRIIRNGIRLVLADPRFLLFHEEKANSNLSSEALAYRVAFFLSRSIPDDLMYQDILDNKIHLTLESHVDRILDNSQKRLDFAKDFVGQWLGSVHASIGGAEAALADDLNMEGALIFADMIENNTDIREIVKPGFSYLNQRLATHYGVQGTFTNQFQKFRTPRRGGVLRWGAFLARMESGIVQRGLAVTEALLCQSVGAPTGIQITDLPPQPTYREKIQQLERIPACMSCHSFINPPGYALEGLDELGRLRGVDSKGEALRTDGVLGGVPFKDDLELAEILQDHPKLPDCAAQKLLAYSIQRNLRSAETCHATRMKEAVFSKEKNYGVRSLIKEILNQPLFQAKGGQ